MFSVWLYRRLPCHISDLFKFCWTLFVYTKGTKKLKLTEQLEAQVQIKLLKRVNCSEVSVDLYSSTAHICKHYL